MKRAVITTMIVGVTMMAVNAVGAATAYAGCWEGWFKIHLWLTRIDSECYNMAPNALGEYGYYYKVFSFGKYVTAGDECDQVEAGEASEYPSEAACLSNETGEGTGGWERTSSGPEFLNASGATPSGVTFTGKSGTGKLQAEGATITCSSSTSSGTITAAPNVGKVLVTYSGCEKGTAQCRTPGHATGKIVTELLAGKLGETTQATSGVGLLLAPETGTKFTELESTGRSPCVTAGNVLITGSVIGEVSPVNGAAQTTGKLIFEKAGEVTQKITAFTGAGEDTLLAFGGLRSSIQQNNELTFSEAIKVS